MEYFAVIAFFLALSARSNADGSLEGLVYAPGHASVEYYAYPKYAFEYAVRDPHTGDNKAQWEKRDGDVVIGAYSLVEPDGSLRVVEYRADDKSGFNAVVKRIGPNIHPVATPIYKASIPSIGYKSYLPHSIGPVAGLDKLASEPIYAPPPAIIKAAPIAPLGKIINAPYFPPAPIYNADIIPKPIYKAPIYKEPILPTYKHPLPYGPIYKTPVLQAPYNQVIIPQPILKPAPLPPEPIYSPYLGKSTTFKNLESLGYNILGKNDLDYNRLIDYNAPLIHKGYPGLGYGH